MKYMLKCVRAPKLDKEVEFVKELANHLVFKTEDGNIIKTTKTPVYTNTDFLNIVSTKQTLIFAKNDYYLVMIAD